MATIFGYPAKLVIDVNGTEVKVDDFLYADEFRLKAQVILSALTEAEKQQRQCCCCCRK